MAAPYDQWFGWDAFDATYGYDREALLRVGVPDEPDGFADFWAGRYEQALAVDLALQLRQVPGPDRFDVFDVGYTSLGGVRIGGWLVVPSDGVVERGLVISHGYGGRDSLDLDLVPDRVAAIFPVSRGLPTRSITPGIPSDGMQHVLHGIESVETYIHGGCAADVWCAASVLTDVLPARPDRLGYVGNSFGGGIGALALPWDDRFDAAVLSVPSFGNHGLRLTMPCTGSGESVRRYVADHPGAREVLSFFDAAVAARRIRARTLVASALWDPTVPPPGQFAVFNAIPGPKELLVLSAGHAEYPGQGIEDERYLSALRAFFR